MSAPPQPADRAGTSLAADFARCFDALAGLGRDRAAGGWNRFAWTPADRAARAWFVAAAAARGLDARPDRNGNLWAWWGRPAPGAVATGSHLDTVPGGGAYDGALGVVSALVAVAELQRRGVRPRRPVAVVAFADEEGARFGLATFGSRLLTGALDPAAVRRRTDRDGVSVEAALEAFGVDPAGLGPDPARLAQLGCFVELHVEQGRGLADLGAPLAVGSGIWPHGRWRLRLVGEGNHAGTTRLVDRRDPVLVLAAAIAAARELAGDTAAVATVGRLEVEPNSTNSVPAAVTAWLDARAADDPALEAFLHRWTGAVEVAADDHGVDATVTEESRSAGVRFDPDLADRLAAVLAAAGLPAPRLATAAGHDAGALTGSVPTGMLFVRNPTGISHSPAETASTADCLTGTRLLAAVIEELACR